jgi:hypothetical protein
LSCEVDDDLFDLIFSVSQCSTGVELKLVASPLHYDIQGLEKLAVSFGVLYESVLNLDVPACSAHCVSVADRAKLDAWQGSLGSSQSIELFLQSFAAQVYCVDFDTH